MTGASSLPPVSLDQIPLPSSTAPDTRSMEDRAVDFLKFGAPSAVAGFVDTVGMSVGVLDDNSMADSIRSFYPEFGAYYKENREGARVVGDMVGMFLPGMAAVKAIRAGSWLNRLMVGQRESTALSSIFTSGKSYSELTKAVKARDLHLAGGKVNGVAIGSLDFANDLTRKSLVREALTTKALDSFKEAVAFEAGVLATMNASDTLYPSEFTIVDHMTLFAGGTGLFMGVEAAFLNRAFRNSAYQAGKAGYAAKDRAGLSIAETMFTPGNRDIGITSYALQSKYAADSLQTVRFATDVSEADQALASRVLNSEVLSYSTTIKEQVKKLGNDSIIPGITTRITLADNSPEIKGVMNALEIDPTTMLGTLSLEKLPSSVEAMQSVLKTRETAITKLEKELGDLQLIAELPDAPANVSAQITGMQAKIQTLKDLQFVVNEADGTLSHGRLRKPLFQDGDRRISKTARTQTEASIYHAEVASDPVYGTNRAVIGVDESGMWIVPQVSETKLSGINVTKILQPSDLGHGSEHFKLLLKDMGQDWHYKSGLRGKAIYNRLPQEIQREIRSWTSGSEFSRIRYWVDNNDPKAKVLYDAYAPVRDRLRELADDDGTIVLLRGESKAETEKPTNDVVSMTSNPAVAKRFGTHIISRRVHVDDVIMIVGGLGSEFEFIVKGNTRRNMGQRVTVSGYEALTLYQRSAGYAAAQKAVASFDPLAKDAIYVAPGTHHTQLDFIDELHKQYGDEIFNRVKLPQSWKSIDDVRFAAVKSKYTEFARLQTLIDNYQGDSALIKVRDTQRLSQQDIIRMLNLPGTPTGETHPLVNFFLAAHVQGSEVLPARNLDELYDYLRGDALLDGFDVKQLPELLQSRVEVRGNMMNIPEDARASLLIKRPIDAETYTREGLISQATMHRETMLNELRNADKSGATLVKQLTSMMETASETALARDLTHLGGEGVQRSDRQALTTGVFSTNASPTMQAVHSLESRMTREAEEFIGDTVARFTPTFTQLRATNSQGDMVSLALYMHARRMGWDVAEEIVQQDGLTFFKLTDTAENRKRWQTLYKDEMPKEALMPTPTKLVGGKREYKPLGITDLAFEGATALRDYGLVAVTNTNAIKRAGGFGATTIKPWWVPPKNLSRQDHIFLVDSRGELYTVAHGRTYAEAQSKAAAIIENAGQPLMPVDRNDMSKYFKLNDDAFTRMLDYTDPLMQTGRATGKSVAPDTIELGSNVLDDAITSINKQLQSIPRRTRAIYFEPQIRQARLMYNAAEGTARQKGQTIWQHYVGAIFGNQTMNPNDAIGQTYYTIESLYDKALNGLFDQVQGVVRGGSGVRKEISRFDRKAYAQFEKATGGYNPFASSVDFAERTFNLKTPPSMKRHMAAINSFTSLLTLRLMDMGHAVLNMTSLAATMPGVIKALQRMPGEDLVQWQARTGSFARPIDDKLGMFDAGRAVTSAIHDLWTKPDIVKQAAKKGYFTQDVSEQIRTLTAPRQGYAESLVTKGLDKLSIISDKSEELARAVSFMTGYHIAQRGHGMGNMDDAFAFAHRFANEVIGDYRPNNRPRIFQGAVGMPLGLFQTFAWNYFQRVFGYIENRQVAALVTQYATQAAVFGAQTVPGFQQFNEFFASNYDGTVNPIDGIRNNFGDDVADWFLYGTLSNLPKMFGADDGIALTNRGDMNMHRVPGLWNVADTAPMKMIANGWGALSETAAALRSDTGLSQQQLAEITANYSIWRAGRNMIELYTGVSTDRRGQLISEDTRTGMGIAARVVGMKPMREAKMMEAWHRIRGTEFSRNERMLNLRDSARALTRKNGKINEDDVANMLRDYIRGGGDPANFSTFLMNQILTSNVERSTKKFLDIMADPNRLRDTKRLFETMALSPNDPSME